MLSANSFAAQLLSNAKSPDDLRDALMASPERHPEMPVKFWLDIHTLLEDERSDEDRVIDLACAYFDAAARRQFVADGSQDIGTCGGVMLGYRANTKFAKALIARGVAYKSGGRAYLRRSLPAGVHTQHMTVDEKAHDAFAEVARVAGYAPAEHRSYVD